MPGLPGAMYNASTCGDWAIFHARACSRPPEPTTRTFMESPAGRAWSSYLTTHKGCAEGDAWTKKPGWAVDMPPPLSVSVHDVAFASPGTSTKRRRTSPSTGVSFDEAAQALCDPHAITIQDLEHSTPQEDRWTTLGMVGDRWYVLRVTWTEPVEDEYRIISARQASPAAVAAYLRRFQL